MLIKALIISALVIDTVTCVPGGWSNAGPVNLNVIKLSLKMQKSIQQRVNGKFGVFIPVSFSSQVVAGSNYLVKVFVGEPDVCVHVSIFQALPVYGGQLSVTGVRYPKKFEDPLIPF